MATTSGEKIKLMGGNYIYQLPSIPNDEREIIGYNLPKKEQFWRLPTDINKFRAMSVGQRKEFVEKERDRWDNGVWFMNNGEPTYLTGMNYDHLVNQTFDFGKAKYYECQRHDFYFRDLCRKDPLCYGGLFLKPRRYGMTTEEITNQQYVAMKGMDMHCGMVSADNKKTISTIFRPTVDSFIRRPRYTRPTIYMPNNKKPKTEMLFQSAEVKDGDSDDLFFNSNGDLNSWIKHGACVVNIFDGYKIHYLTGDEVWKWVSANPKEFWEIHKKCLEDGGIIIGKASMLSTMGDSDDQKEAIAAGVDMWYGSDPDKRNANGQTDTGLYRWFIDAIYTQRAFCDVYGRVDVERAAEKLANDLANIPVGSKEYVFEKRRMPRCVEDALLSADTSTTFDNKRIMHRLEIIKKMDPKPYVIGNTHEHPHTGRIEFQPDPYGNIKLFQAPYTDIRRQIDASNRFRKVNGIYIPPVNQEGAAGYDPVNFADSDTKSNSISRAAYIARQKFDYFGHGDRANRFWAQFVYRPDDPSDADYEAIKLCRMLGIRVMIDRSGLTRIKMNFKKHGMMKYLMRNPKDEIYGMLADNQRAFVKEGVNKVGAYWKMPRLQKLPDEIQETDWLLETPSEEVLEDAKVFNPMKTTKTDAMSGMILCEFGLDQVKETSERDMASSGINNNPFFAKRA